MTGMIGKTILHYKILEKLGEARLPTDLHRRNSGGSEWLI